MTVKLRTKMATSHGIVAIVAVFLVILVSYLIINEKFLDYIAENRLSEHQTLVNSLENLHNQEVWDKENIENIVTNVFESGLKEDLEFLYSLNMSLLWVAGISFLFALLLSNFVSSSISSHLSKIIRIAKELSQGKKVDKELLIESYITEIKELGQAIREFEQNLMEKEESNKRLTADIAHELRTPLSTLQSHLEALMDGVWKPTHERLSSCHEEIIRMTSLVKDLEDLYNYERAQIKLSKSEFDIEELINNISTNFESEFMKKDIEFTFSGQRSLIVADRDKLGQVIVNLISNSLKYTSSGGKVLVNFRNDHNFLYFTINDNGMGISKEDLPNIFDRLYRADVSRNRSTGGAGIGLAIAKAIIEAHSGHIDVVSQLGMGTEVTFIIPKVLQK